VVALTDPFRGNGALRDSAETQQAISRDTLCKLGQKSKMEEIESKMRAGKLICGTIQ